MSSSFTMESVINIQQEIGMAHAVRTVVVAVLVTLALTAPSAAQTAPRAANDQGDIMMFRSNHDNAMMAKSRMPAASAEVLDRVMDLFTDDAVLLPPGEAAVRGKAAVREWLTTKTPPTPGNVGVDLQISGDHAWCALDPSARSRMAPAGSAAAADTARIVWWLAKGADGKWRIARSTWNAVPAPAAK